MMRSAIASAAFPSSCVKNCQLPAFAGVGGLASFGCQGSILEMTAPAALWVTTKHAAVPSNSLRCRRGMGSTLARYCANAAANARLPRRAVAINGADLAKVMSGNRVPLRAASKRLDGQVQRQEHGFRVGGKGAKIV